MTNAGLVLDALGDPTRRLVFQRLREGARAVTEISRGMKVTRPAVSQHLRVLKEARLVTDHAEGTRRVYAIDSRGVEALRAWLDTFWDTTLVAFKEAAELEARRAKNHGKGARK
jgi:DNA-binding transcriptional ArsR family regulator